MRVAVARDLGRSECARHASFRRWMIRSTLGLMIASSALMASDPPYPMSGAADGLYGPGISFDSLRNVVLGGHHGGYTYIFQTRAFVRFRAEQSSDLTTVIFYYKGPLRQTASCLAAPDPYALPECRTPPGYAGGTGGDLRLRLYANGPDGFPAGDPLASQFVAADPWDTAGRSITFSQPYRTEAGRVYHLVFENVDADPVSNYFSPNFAYRHIPAEHAEETGPLHPRFADVMDWGSGYFSLASASWVNVPRNLPILGIGYANGTRQGMSYGEISRVESGVAVHQRVGKIGGPGTMARQRFTVSGDDRSIRGVGVRLLKEVGTNSDLIATIVDENGQSIATAAMPFAAVPSGPPAGDYEDIACTPANNPTPPCSWDGLGYRARWVMADFDHAVVLRAGRSYSLQLSSERGTYWAWVVRRLSISHAYGAVTAFADGEAQYLHPGETGWRSLGRVANANDLQFYLTAQTTGDRIFRDGFEPTAVP